MNRVIEIQNDGYFLSSERGFMVLEKKGEPEARHIPLDDIGVLILSGGCSLSTNLINRLVDAGSAIVVCGANYHPHALIQPVVGNQAQSGRIRQQMNASLPLQKRIWQALVQAKICNQGEVLAQWNGNDGGLADLASRVGSGDPDNKEGQAARRHWPALFGPDFRRDPALPGTNALLNYGYAIVRAQVARSVAACGLYPGLGVKHENDQNPFCLVDDLIEPFRPVVDHTVRGLTLDCPEPPELTPQIKRELAAILQVRLRGREDTAILPTHILRLCQSLVTSFETGKNSLILPLSVLPVAEDSNDPEET